MIKITVILLIAISVSGQAWSKRLSMYHMGRKFTVVVPDRAPSKNRPLLVLLHGCKQSPSLILDGTALEAEAQKNDFVILAPEQPNYYNIDHCWNWFLDIHQQRLVTNEMGQIISAISVLSETHKINSSRIYLTGISAGGVMAHNLTSCYPDVFAGSAIHSGLNFKSAETIAEAQTVLTSYDQKSPAYLGKKMYECGRNARTHKLSKVMIIHGEEDSRVPSLHSELISRSQAVWRDYLDDGKRNDSVRAATSTATIKFPKGYQVEKSIAKYPGFEETKLIVRGLGHAWGGGKPVSVNFDPAAPSSNKFILDYFELSK